MLTRSRYPFLVIAVVFAAGIIIGRWITLPFSFLVLFFILCLPLILIVSKHLFFLILIISGVFVLGLMHGSSSNVFPKDHISHGFPENTRVVCQGEVITVPLYREEGKKHTLRFRMRLEDIFHKGIVEYYSGDIQVFHYGGAEEISVGDRLRVRGTLSRARSAANPGQLDYRRYLKGVGVFALLRSFGSNSITIIERGKNGLSTWIGKVRQRLLCRIDKILPFPENKLLSALLIGERGGIPHDLRNLFVQTGTIHLLAISGLHVSLIIGFFYSLQRFFGVPQKLNAATSIVLLVVYVALAGSRTPTQRAGLMGIFFLTGILLERGSGLINAIAMAFFFMLLMRPTSLYQPGFQLSFVTITSIVVLAPRLDEYCTGWLIGESKTWLSKALRNLARFLMRMVVGTAAAMIGAFPLVAYYFHLFSPIGLIANVIAVPVVLAGLIMGIVALAGSFIHLGLGSCLGLGAVLSLRLAQRCLEAFLVVPWGTLSVSPPHIIITLLYYGTVLWLLYGKPILSISRRWCLALIVWVGVFLIILVPNRNSAVMTFLDVGRAKAMHVSFNGNEHWLINGGRKAPSCNGRWIVAPFLRSKGVQNIRGVLTTSNRADSWGGLKFVTDEFPCNYFFTHPSWNFSESQSLLLKWLRRKRVNIVRLKNGDIIRHGEEECYFKIISDEAPCAKRKSRRRSLAIRFSYGDFKALFIPDGDRDLLRLISSHADGGYDLLWLPGNGKWIGDEEADFLRLISPKITIVSGHVKDVDEKIQKLLLECGSQVLDTGSFGAISVRIDKKGISINTFTGGALPT